MDSKYLKKVMRLVRKIYPGIIWKETNLQNLVDGTNFSPALKRLMALCHADLRKMRVDIYVKGQVAIEVHGEQHDKPIKFSNEILDPEAELLRRQQLDRVKDNVLAEAGIPLVTVWYSELNDGLLTEDVLRNRIRLIQEITNKVPKQKRLNVKVPKFRTRTESFDARRDRLAKARKIRKAAYRKAKLNRIKKDR